MPRRANTLQALLDQEAKIKEAIAEAKRREAAAAAAIDDERHRIIGAALVAEMKAAPSLSATLQAVIEKRVTKARERLALGLDPATPLAAKKGQKKSPPAHAGEVQKQDKVTA
jgi:hypothetical protein